MVILKKSIFILVTFCFVLCLCGCSKIEKIDYKEVSVEVVDVSYTPSRHSIYYDHLLKVHRVRAVPAKYETCVYYSGSKYYLCDEDSYDICKNKIGKEVKAYLKVIYLSNGDVSYNIYGIVGGTLGENY